MTAGSTPSHYDNIKSNIGDPKFKPLEDVFRSNYQAGYERGGAAFAVYYKTKLVAEIWGGKKNMETEENWIENTKTVLFSTTKSISATILAYVLDKENVGYNTKLTDFWPEFGKNGKENTTVLMVTLHQCGIPYTSAKVTRSDVSDWRQMSEYFENACPIWPPGTKTGYHALTIGFLIDQIVRRIDSKRRGLVEIFKEDFQKRYDIRDLSIGLESAADNMNVTILSTLTEEEVQKEGLICPESLRRWKLGNNQHNDRLYETWPWITVEDYNVLENRLLPMTSNMGIGSARGLAHFHSLLSTKTILSPKMYDLFENPVLVNEMDIVNQYTECKGYGWQFTKNPKGQWIFGHSGFGGQNVRVDTHNQLSFAYICNALKIFDADLVPSFKNLQEKLYELI